MRQLVQSLLASSLDDKHKDEMAKEEMQDNGGGNNMADKTCKDEAAKDKTRKERLAEDKTCEEEVANVETCKEEPAKCETCNKEACNQKAASESH